MQKKLHIKKGDQVVVIAGNEKSKTGKVLSVSAANNRAIVEGVNMISKHSKPSATNADGGIVKMEAAIHISNLMLLDSKGVASRVRREKNSKGVSVRKSIKSSEEI